MSQPADGNDPPQLPAGDFDLAAFKREITGGGLRWLSTMHHRLGTTAKAMLALVNKKVPAFRALLRDGLDPDTRIAAGRHARGRQQSTTMVEAAGDNLRRSWADNHQ